MSSFGGPDLCRHTLFDRASPSHNVLFNGADLGHAVLLPV